MRRRGVRLIAVVGVALQLIELSGTPLAVSKIGGVPRLGRAGRVRPEIGVLVPEAHVARIVRWPGGGPAGAMVPPNGAQHVSFGV